MPEVRPFQGLRYSPAVAGDLGAVLSPPYDVISPQDQERLYRRHPNNVVRLELARNSSGAAEDRYALAAQTLARWRRDGVLVRDQAPAMYLARHEFPWRGRPFVRTELTLAVRLEALGAGGVRPHEDTRSGPKEDRLRLMLATHAAISPVMLLYRANATLDATLDRVTTSPAPISATLGEGERLSVWAVTGQRDLDTIQRGLAGETLYVADGHHRYETALSYRDRMAGPTPADGPRACDYVMAALISFSDPGLLSLPYHRLLKGLDAAVLERVRRQLDTLCVEERHPMPHATPAQVAEAALDSLARGALFEVWGLEPATRSTLRLKEPAALKGIAGGRPSPARAGLATSVFREAVLRPALGVQEEEAEGRGWLTFAKDAAEAVAQVNAGAYQAAFLPAPVPMDVLREVSDRGERLPPKSTYFYPKLLTGLVIHPLDDPSYAHTTLSGLH